MKAKTPFASPSDVRVSRQVRELIEANNAIAKVLNLWTCGYTVDMVQREMPQLEAHQVVDILNLQFHVAHTLRRADGGAQ